MMSAIILAAGYSSRMGVLKPLLPIGQRTAIEVLVQSFIDAGIADIGVVLGHRAEEIHRVIEPLGARSVINSNFNQGMFSSICAGIAALPASAEACFVIPADIPLVRASSIRRLAHFFPGKARDVVYPVFKERRGHPPLISRSVLMQAPAMGSDGRLSTLLAGHEHNVCNLFVPDEGILLDMDTPDEFAAILELSSRRDIPSPRECEALLAMYQPEESVIRHSLLVSAVAYRLARALAENGVPIDPLLTRAGGFLHDVSKGTPEHATAGANLLRNFQFMNVAAIVAAHTNYAFEPQVLDEAAIVYLADKLVSGDRVVGIAQRFHRSIERFRENPIALAAALRRRATAEAIAYKIECHLGVELQTLVGGAQADDGHQPA